MHLNQKEAEEDQGRMWVMLMSKSGAQEYPLLFQLPYHFHFCLPPPLHNQGLRLHVLLH